MIETNSPNKTALTIFSTGKTYQHISEIRLYIVCDWRLFSGEYCRHPCTENIIV